MQGRFSSVLGLVSLMGFLSASLVSAATIDTPMTVVECQPISISWHNADPSGPVYISLVEGKDTSGTPLIQFQPQPGSAEGTLVWPKVNVTAGTQFTLIVNDATGKPNFSGQAVVQHGPESGTCGAIGSGTSGGSSGGASSGGASSGATSTGTSSGSSTPASSSSSSTTPSSSGTSSSGSTSSTSSTGSSSSVPKTSTGSTNTTSSSSKPASGTNGANVNAIVHPVMMASFAIVFGSALAVSVL
ncbi:uncharacterized protein FA14DRAFT_170944 [Meira miltonrushii]|uniref:Ser-Thr-rich glycosyl-phosphatidyl-inositol-anchored membrane family-domain-containing protein n=1 Tax=Meira miltonrushii TaxID=1280837 RepID=A0A316VPZ9_9BASI|nr:uncharacterized protein FA14DRAFT_170944 [Meira miltonrushii]PWN38231.1 hypothetical protein FA14DRAFT_170944 [Meira miltonrushii]